MATHRDAQLLALVSELERQDADVAARIDAVVALLDRVDAVRASARRVSDALAALPGAVAVAEGSKRDAVAREDEARAELVVAERRLAEVAGSRRASDETKTEAERAVRRASVAATDAADAVARMRERVAALQRDEAALHAEAERLAVEAQHVARAVAEVPRLSDSGRTVPGSSLAEIDEWGARTHAALFVVRGGLEGEREKVVLEAHALAAAALGDQTGGASVALVRRRLEDSLAEG
jgi:chromosome segregation ATPase